MSYPQGSQQAPWATAGTAAQGQQSWQTQANPYDQYASSTSSGLTAEQQAMLYQQQAAGTAAAGAAANWQQGLYSTATDDGKNATGAAQVAQATSPWGAQSASSWAAASKVQPATAAAGQPWTSGWGAQSTSWQTTAVPDYASQAKVWLGTVTQLIPPNYGIIDSIAFYVHEVVTPGTKLPQVGDRVKVEALPATDGGQYSWRCTRVEVDTSTQTQPTAASATAAASNPYGTTTVTLSAAAKASAIASAAATAAAAAAAAAANAPTAIPANKPFFRGSSSSSSRLGISVSKSAPAEKAPASDGKYNMVAPPTSAYTADLALAAAANAIESAQGGAVAPPAYVDTTKKAAYVKPPPQLTDEEKRKSEQAVQQLKNYGDPSGIGARLLTKMGFGAAGGQGLGKNEQGIAAPVDPKSTMGQRGLGFDGPGRDSDRGRNWDKRSSRRDSGWESKRRRSYSRSSSRSRSRSYSRSRSRGRSASRSRSPSKRYTCRPPKATTYDSLRGIASLSKRYSQMYIPSDFIKVQGCWLDSCPDLNPLALDIPVVFKIEDREEATEQPASVKTENGHDTGSAPASAEWTEAEIAAGKLWSAKVVLMSGINSTALHAADARLFQHPVQHLKFLVGKKGKGELLLLGGAWDPVDGAPPQKDPWSLTRTATRTFKDATGLDLTQCTQWVKFAEAQYLRSSSSRTETVVQRTVMFLVDVLSLTTPIPAAVNTLTGAENATQEEEAAQKELESLEAELKESEASGGVTQTDGKVDLTSLTVAQLQEELSKRGLDTKWQPLKGKKELVDRLKEHIEQNPGSGEVVLPQAVAKADAQAALTELREKVAKARDKLSAARATTRSAPRVLEHPPCMDQVVVRCSKSSRVQCVTYSLDALLDYTLDDTKETTFEVSLFAELFLEMMQTRFGRVIYKCLPTIIEKLDKARQDDKRRDRDRGRDRDRDGDKDSTRDKDKDSTRDKGKEGTKPTSDVKQEVKQDGKRESKQATPAKETAAAEVTAPAKEGTPSKEATPAKEPAPAKEAAPVEVVAATEEAEQAKEATPVKEAAPGKESTPAEGDEKAAGGTGGQEAAEPTDKAQEPAAANADEAAAMDVELAAEPKADEGTAAPAPEPTPAAEAAPEPLANGAASETPAVVGNKRPLESETPQGESKKVKSEPETDDAPVAQPTAPPEKLQLACRFFDEKCAGYLDLEDLEEILFMTVQDVSRRRVQQLVEAVCKRDRMSYGDYTDVVVPSSSATPATKGAPKAAVDGGVNASSTSGRDVVVVDGVSLDLFQVQQRLAAAETSKRKAEVAVGKVEQEAAELRASEAKLKERVKRLTAQITAMESTLAATSSVQQQMEAAVSRCVATFQATQAALQEGCSILTVPISLPAPQAPEEPEQDEVMATKDAPEDKVTSADAATAPTAEAAA